MGCQWQLIPVILDGYKDKSFDKDTFDCFVYTNTFWKDFYGFYYAPQILGRYSYRTTEKEFRELIGYDSVSDGLNDIMKPTGKYPPRGALVKSGDKDFLRIKLGICVGDKVGYISRNGILYEGLDSVTESWINKD